MRCFRSFLPLVVLAALSFVVGCGGPKMAPVEGTVKFTGGQPLTKGEVTFHPDVEGGNTQKYPDMPRGKIDSNGKYTIMTSGTPGAPVGKYKATVNPNAGEMPDNYAVPKEVIDKTQVQSNTTDLKVEVTADPSGGKYDLVVRPAK
jgi:hypothetical protein